MSGPAATVERLNAQSEVRGLLAQMQQCAGSWKHLPRYRQLSDQMETLVMSYLEPEILDPIPGVRLTRLENRLLLRLMEAKGGHVSKDAIMAALYFDRPDCDMPEIKLVDVFICKLRAKINGSPWRVETSCGLGYRLTSDQ